MKTVASLALLGAFLAPCVLVAITIWMSAFAPPSNVRLDKRNAEQVLGRPEFRMEMWGQVMIDPQLRTTLIADPAQPGGTKKRHYFVLVPGTLAVQRPRLSGFDWHSVLKSKVVRNEIGCTPAQLVEIDKVLNLADEIQKGVWREDSREQSLRQISVLAERLVRLLEPSQLLRLKQLMLRYRFDKDGFDAGAFEGLQVSDKQSESMKRKSKTLSKHVFDGDHSDRFDWYERLLKPLSKDQQDRLVQILGVQYIEAYRANWLLPTLHLVHSPLHQNVGQLPEDELGYDGLLTVDAFHDEGAGHYEMQYFNYGNGSGDLSEAAFRSYLNMLDSEKIRGDLKLSTKQIQQLATLTRAEKRENGVRAAKGNYQLLTFEQLSQERVVAVRELSRLVEQKIVSFLTGEQTAELRKLCGVTGAWNRGIAASLIDGYLNRQLAVTDDQRDTIRKVATTIRREICEYDARIRETYYDAMIACLNESQQEQIREKMGEPLPGGWLQQSVATR